MTKLRLDQILISLFILFTAIAFFRIHTTFVATGEGFSKTRDVFFIFNDAKLLAEGENPYARIKDQDLTKNRKYTFYLPAFLIGAAAAIKAGFNDYQSWMALWIPVSLLFHISVGLVVLFAVYRVSGALPAILASSIWLFSRWPLALYKSGQIDAIGILFFALSIAFLHRRFFLALFFFGLSLSVKQMAAFCLPLYVLWTIQHRASYPMWSAARFYAASILSFALLPIIIALPMFLWDPESFLRMLYFPLSRAPRGANSFDIFLGLSGPVAKLPFLLLLFATYWMSWKGRISKVTALLLATFFTLSFNAVFFTRYFCWALVPLGFQLFANSKDASTGETTQQASPT